MSSVPEQIHDYEIRQPRPDEFDETGRVVAAAFGDDGQTVADLVGYMTSNGLKFAPAVSGDEAAYASLYSALAAYRRGLETEVAREPGK